MSSDLPAISILIRTFNSAPSLKRLLQKLPLLPADEVVVADSGSRDQTETVAREQGATFLNVPPPFNYSKSLNAGFRATRNAWVLVISSHSFPMVENLLQVFRGEIRRLPPDVAVAYAPSTLNGKCFADLPTDRVAIYGAKEYPAVSGLCGNGNTIYRRTAWTELPFDEHIRTAEDKVWIIEMLRRSYRFAYIPHAPCRNENQGSLRYMFHKGFRDARAFRATGHRPMRPLHLAGALKNLLAQFAQGEIGAGNWIRYSAHNLGQFFGSYQPEENSSPDGSS